VFLIYSFRRIVNVVFLLWLIPGRLNFICRRFGTLCLFYLHMWFKRRVRGSQPKTEVLTEDGGLYLYEYRTNLKPAILIRPIAP